MMEPLSLVVHRAPVRQARDDHPPGRSVGGGRFFAIVTVGLCVLLGAGCDEGRQGPLRILAEEEHLAQQVADLRALVQRAEKGALIPTNGLLVVVQERVVREVLQRALPFDQRVLERFDMHMESGDVTLEDGHGTVRLDGRVDWAAQTFGFEGNVSADVTVFGRVDVQGANTQAGTLSGRVVPYGFEIHRLWIGNEQPGTRRLMEALGRALPEALAALSTRFTIPVAFERRLVLDGVEDGPVRVPDAAVPLRVAVREATAHGGRLWILLEIVPGAWETAS